MKAFAFECLPFVLRLIDFFFFGRCAKGVCVSILKEKHMNASGRKKAPTSSISSYMRERKSQISAFFFLFFFSPQSTRVGVSQVLGDLPSPQRKKKKKKLSFAGKLEYF